jgi:hypothetical protein
MKRRSIIAVIVTAILLSSVGSAAAYDPSTIVVSDIPGQSTSRRASAHTDGQTVVWVERFEGRERGGRAYMADLSTLAPVQVTSESVFEIAMDQRVVVWSGSETDSTTGRPLNFNIKGIDLERGTQYDFSTPNHDAMPAIGYHNIVWVSVESDPDSGIGSKWILTQHVEDDAPTVIAEVNGHWSTEPPKIDHFIVWRERTNDGSGYLWRLWMASLYTEPTLIDQGHFEAEEYSKLSNYDIEGEHIVYSGDDGLIAFNYMTRERMLIADDSFSVTLNTPFAFWLDPAEPVNEFDGQIGIYAYDLDNDRAFTAAKVERETLPTWEHVSEISANAGFLLWTRNRIGPFGGVGSAIHATSIRDLMPIAPRPDPGTTDRNWLYLDKTGHYLSYGFKDFWVQSGGLPVFGYPLTTEFDELNADLGEMRTVQYLERQRFEYHPAYAGTPYETLLGRLGAEDAWIRGLEDHHAFQPLPSGTRSTSTVDFFPETGHTLTGPFRVYWYSHGLDFGDSGVSFRESLALFGYPISEEFVDPDTGLVTQYFERAVFEYHEDNSDPYKVLLRRLGADRLHMYGW